MGNGGASEAEVINGDNRDDAGRSARRAAVDSTDPAVRHR